MNEYRHKFKREFSFNKIGEGIWTNSNNQALQNFVIQRKGTYNVNDATGTFNSYGGGSGGKYESRRAKELDIFINGY